jgi:hypothetical protein
MPGLLLPYCLGQPTADLGKTAQNKALLMKDGLNFKINLQLALNHGQLYL